MRGREREREKQRECTEQKGESAERKIKLWVFLCETTAIHVKEERQTETEWVGNRHKKPFILSWRTNLDIILNMQGCATGCQQLPVSFPRPINQPESITGAGPISREELNTGKYAEERSSASSYATTPLHCPTLAGWLGAEHTQTHTHTETRDTHTDRHTDRHTHTHTLSDRERHSYTHKHTHTHTGLQILTPDTNVHASQLMTQNTHMHTGKHTHTNNKYTQKYTHRHNIIILL